MQEATPSGSQSRARHIRLCGQNIEEPGHICAFFDSRQEKYATLAPFFRDAIAAGDRVINVVDAASRTEHLAALKEARVPVEDAIRSDQFRLLTSEETYMRHGELNLDGVLDMLRDELRAAEKGGSRVRTCGEMTWVGRDPRNAGRAMEYEARVNQFVPSFDCTLLCVYDVAATPAGLVSDILATHPVAIINGRMRPNPYFVQPDDYLAMLRSRNGAGGDGSA